MTKTILIIENDADIRDIITYVLDNEGFRVVGMSASKSLTTIIQHKPDLILIDEWVSGYPGHRLCLRIKQFHQLMQVPVIILSTANDIVNIVAECKADGYIRKPFDLTELVDAVQEHLPNRV